MSVATELKSVGHAISYRCGLSAVMAHWQTCGRILMYHGIATEDAPELKAQLQYMARHFKVVSLESMVCRLAGNLSDNDSTCSADEIVLTFDDGLRNNLTVVYPILQQLQLPATFFVCPELIETQAWLWNHEMRCRLQTLAAPALAELGIHLTGPATLNGIIEWMKKLALQQRHQAEEVVRQSTPDFQPTLDQKTTFDMMNWDDLLSFDPSLITIGSHTLSHPILTTLSASETEHELIESRQFLERKLQREVNFFCYPNGSYDARAYKIAQKTYRAAVTTNSGVLDGKEPMDLHRLPRIPSADKAALTAWRLHRPEA